MKNIHRLTPWNFVVLMLLAIIGYTFALANAVHITETPDGIKKILFTTGVIIPLLISVFIMVGVWQALHKKRK